MSLSTRIFTRKCLLGIVILGLLGWLAGCFHSDGNGGLSGTRTLNINTGSKGQNITMVMGEMWEMVIPVDYNVRNKGGPFAGFSMNLEELLPYMSVTLPGQAQAALRAQAVTPAVETSITATMHLRVSRREMEETVCTDGELYGPFEVTLDVNYQPASVSPSTVIATETTTDIINTGAYVVCIQVLPPVDALVELELLRLSIEGCDETPANIAGEWGGSYACNDNCGNESGSIEMTITQSTNNRSVASYSDGSASYEGVVCGNRFTFKGGASTYDESGTFVLNADGSASKSSTYRSHPPGSCGGTCTDSLVRVN